MISFSKLNKTNLIILGWLMLFTIQASAQTDSAKESDVNKKPLEDFVASFLEKNKTNKTDLNKPFLIEFEAKLISDGNFDRTTTRFTKIEGDEDIVNIIESGLIAVGDSGILKQLIYLDVDAFTLTIKQDKENFLAKIVSTLDSEEKARTVASGFNGVLTIAKIQKQSRIEKLQNEDIKKSEIDQLNLLQNTKVFSNDKSFVLQVSLPKSVAQEMIQRNLTKEIEKREK